jgi:nicotinate phosphoribosyltransferase
VTSHWVNDDNAVLLTDLYELAMLQAYFLQGMNETAVFDFYIRRLPEDRNYLVACGLDDVLHYLETLRFSEPHLDYLRSLDRFSPAFIDHLAGFRFTGEVWAVPEGTVVFANEPILEIIAPIPEAQLVETFVMNQLHIATMAASKAARVVTAARGRTVVDFGLRRMHGADAGVKAARAFYVAGVDATSNVLAGEMYGIPLSGTMAHSYVQAHDSEYESFRNFLRAAPDATVLVDTYDTLEGVRQVIQLSRELKPPSRISSIRLDSGELNVLAKESRRLLDEAGLSNVRILASNSLDEYAIESLIASGAPIDGFGVGARMGVSSDAPYLDSAYKLVEYSGKPRIKTSTGKQTLPGRKQIFRQIEDGVAMQDVLAGRDETIAGVPLLERVMLDGRRLQPAIPLPLIQRYCKAQIRSLPASLHALTAATPPFSVKVSPQLGKWTRSARG